MDWMRSPLSCAIGYLCLMATAPIASADELVRLKVGHAAPLTLSGTPTTVAIGNADIAAASVALENTLILIGKKPGTTNVLALDADGSEMTNTIVQVVRADGRRTVSVVRAGQPEAYVCGRQPGCIAVDPGTQIVDYADTNDPATVGTDVPVEGGAQVSTAPAARSLN